MIRRTVRIFSISLLLLVAIPNYAIAYGGHGYHHSYGHSYGHYGYRHYGHHGYGIYFSHHGHIGTAGYVFLGIWGVAVLSQIFNNDNYRNRKHSNSSTNHLKFPTNLHALIIVHKSRKNCLLLKFSGMFKFRVIVIQISLNLCTTTMENDVSSHDIPDISLSFYSRKENTFISCVIPLECSILDGHLATGPLLLDKPARRAGNLHIPKSASRTGEMPAHKEHYIPSERNS